MSTTFRDIFRHEARTQRPHDLPAAPLTAVSGTVATLSVWATMALYQSTTSAPVSKASVVSIPVVIYPVTGLMMGAVWLGMKCADAARTMKKAQQNAAPVPIELQKPAGPRPSY